MTPRPILRAGLMCAGLLLTVPVLSAQDRGSGRDAPKPEPARAAPADAPAVARAAGSDAERIAAQLPTYPIETCVVSGEPLGAMGARKNVLKDGRLVSFCCNNCIAEFDKTPAKYNKALDDAVVAAQLSAYPLTTCPISGEPLESPKSVVVGTRLIQVCCNSCKKDVAADPAGSLAKVDAQIMDVQARDYPLTTCVVDDKPLGDKPVRNLHGLELVEFCSAQCAAHFRAEPPGFLKKLETARAERKARPEKGDKGDKARKTEGVDRPEKGRKGGAADSDRPGEGRP